MGVIRVDFQLYDEFVKKVRANTKEEAVGLFAGTEDESGKTILKFYYLTNLDHALDHYVLDPKEQFEVMKDARANGWKSLGVWYCHPFSPSRPSPEDINVATNPEQSYMVLSLMGENAVCNSFQINKDVVTKEDLRITSRRDYF